MLGFNRIAKLFFKIPGTPRVTENDSLIFLSPNDFLTKQAMVSTLEKIKIRKMKKRQMKKKTFLNIL